MHERSRECAWRRCIMIRNAFGGSCSPPAENTPGCSRVIEKQLYLSWTIMQSCIYTLGDDVDKCRPVMRLRLALTLWDVPSFFFLLALLVALTQTFCVFIPLALVLPNPLP